jgi:hypothetical protein
VALNTITIKINVRKYRRGNQKEQSRETGKIGYTRKKSLQPSMIRWYGCCVVFEF